MIARVVWMASRRPFQAMHKPVVTVQSGNFMSEYFGMGFVGFLDKFRAVPIGAENRINVALFIGLIFRVGMFYRLWF